MNKYQGLVFTSSQAPVHSGQHCPGLVTGWKQGVCGQTRATQVTVPLAHVQCWQGLEDVVKVWPWVWTTPSYRQESHTGQQVSEGTGFEHWTGQGLFWQFTTSFWSEGGWRKEEPEAIVPSGPSDIGFLLIFSLFQTDQTGAWWAGAKRWSKGGARRIFFSQIAANACTAGAALLGEGHRIHTGNTWTRHAWTHHTATLYPKTKTHIHLWIVENFFNSILPLQHISSQCKKR